MQRPFSRACRKQEAADLHEVANIQQLESLIRIFSHFVNTHIDLQTSAAILDLQKSNLAHLPHQANATDQSKATFRPLPFVKMLQNFCNRVATLHAIRIWVDTPLPQ